MLYSPFLWLLLVHRSAKQMMMDLQIDLGGWLEESTLFPNQQTCDRPSSDLYPENKDVPALSDIGDGWLDEKLDLSVFGLQDNWLEPQNDSGKMMAEDASISLILDSLMGSNPVDTGIFPIENEVILPDLDNVAYEILACGESISSPSEDFSSSVSSPASSICSSFSDPLASLQEEKPEMFEYICLLKSKSSVATDPCFEDISQDTESDQSNVGPIFSASNKSNRASPYESKKQARRERKKVQNKEAAARYREKKRNQDKVLSSEVEKLESEQKALQTKYDKLKNEYSYLKSLMKEMIKRKGLSK